MGGYITAGTGSRKANGKPGAFAPGSQYGYVLKLTNRYVLKPKLDQISQPSPFLIMTG
jgi:hypothetical protein